MRGYSNQSYGEAFADVYDDWYDDDFFGRGDTAAAVAALASLCATSGPVLELGVGTGRLAIPLAAALADRPLDGNVGVHGVDASPAMLAHLAQRDGSGRVRGWLGDMVDVVPAGAPADYGLIFVAYNTFFSLTSAADQQRCLHNVAGALVDGGSFVIEAFVPEARGGDAVTVRSMAADRVVLSISRDDPEAQTAEGHFVELTEAGGVRLRPWAIRWATVAQLDDMAAAAGLMLTQRSSSWTNDAFVESSTRHVSVYRRVTGHRPT